jgi:hypothetical protein
VTAGLFGKAPPGETVAGAAHAQAIADGRRFAGAEARDGFAIAISFVRSRKDRNY